MDKRTVLAVVISVVIIVAGVFVNNIFFGPKPEEVVLPNPNTVPNTNNVSTSPTPNATTEPTTTPLIGEVAVIEGLLDPGKVPSAIVPLPAEADSQDIVYNNDTIRVVVSPQGASITSFQLLQYKDHNSVVEMIMPGADSGLITRFGDKAGEIIDVQFINKPSSDKNVIEFYRDFAVNANPEKPFRITKKYTFYPGDYLFELEIGVENSVNDYIPLKFSGASYTLGIGPQIGPVSSNIAVNQDYRRFVYLATSGRQTPALSPNTEQTVTDRVNWAAVDGKYFSFFIIPDAAQYKIGFSSADNKTTVDGVVVAKPGSQLYFTRPEINSSKNVDKFRIYAGPKLSSILSKYNNPQDNPAGQSNLSLEQVVDGDWLGWLSEALKWIMQLFHYVIPNWGIAIILLTVLVKLVLYPLTKKSMESTARMQTLAPKMTELREKYKENPQKMNLELAALYKREKINPLGGCLPMLLQFPFFFAMYSLFNNHFDLRGAMFIPGWITDLSLPDTVIQVAFTVPVINMHITGLHLLPFLYLGSQFLTTKITQAMNGTSSNAQMKIMMYVLPAVFFFVLYEMPSGLLVYWIFQNVLSVGQQILVNKQLQKKKEQSK